MSGFASALGAAAVRWVPRLAVGYLTYRAVTLAVNARVVRRLVPVLPGEASAEASADPSALLNPATPAPRVSLLVPARDEALTLPETLPGLLAQGADEVLVLDDGSTDATAQLAEAAGARVLPGAPAPGPGWAGKPWACQQLADAASGDVLVFTDADVHWEPGALAAVLAERARTGAGLLTVFPRQAPRTVGERLLTPLIDAAFLGHLAAPLMDSDLPGAVAANGQVMVIGREVYRRAGGHAAVSGAVVEDIGLAAAVRRGGDRVVVALGGEAIGVRMYDSYGASVRGLAKSVPGMLGGSRVMVAATAAWYLLVYTAPWFLPGRPLVHLARGLGVLDRAAVGLVTGRRGVLDLAEGLLGPVTPLLALPVFARALRSRVEWKGRSYPR